MVFENLLNKKMTELEMFDRVTEELQKNFLTYQNGLLRYQITAIDDDHSIIDKFVHTVTDAEYLESEKFQYGGPFKKIYLMAKFRSSYYDFTLFGRWDLKSANVFDDRLAHIHYDKRSSDRSKEKVIYDLNYLRAAFGDIAGELQNSPPLVPILPKKIV